MLKNAVALNITTKHLKQATSGRLVEISPSIEEGIILYGREMWSWSHISDCVHWETPGFEEWADSFYVCDKGASWDEEKSERHVLFDEWMETFGKNKSHEIRPADTFPKCFSRLILKSLGNGKAEVVEFLGYGALTRFAI